MNQFHLKPLEQLTANETALWQSICDRNPEFRSPYFQPDFSRCVADVRDDTAVIVVEKNSQPIGFLPIQVQSPGRAVPIGGKLNDLHGVIGQTEINLDCPDFLKSTGLNAFRFHAAKSGTNGFESNQFESTSSPVIDLCDGFDAYQTWVRSCSRTIKRQAQKTRKMISELGPLHFEFHVPDQSIFDRVIEMKRQKYVRTKTFDLFSLDWARELVERLHRVQRSNLAGVLSVLWAGEHLVAGHMGIRSSRVLHYWFPIFDPEFGKYSPGIQLILEMAKACAESGLQEIDLGYGTQPFKYKLANRKYQTVCGKFTRSQFSFSLSRRAHLAKKWMMATPIKPWAKKIIRTIHPKFGHRVFR